jgi:hypothetical protein
MRTVASPEQVRLDGRIAAPGTVVSVPAISSNPTLRHFRQREAGDDGATVRSDGAPPRSPLLRTLKELEEG